jgi:hypothetical protein
VIEVCLSTLDFQQPAILTLWPFGCDTLKAVEPIEMASLAEAIAEASSALREGSGAPWITTACGLILSPAVLLKLLGPP